MKTSIATVSLSGSLTTKLAVTFSAIFSTLIILKIYR